MASIKQVGSWLLFLAIALLCVYAPAYGQDEDYFEMSLEELAAEWRTAVSGSRRVQPIRELSVPVTVVTADDIHYSGLTSIPEILQFAVGMDVVRLNRNFYAVGVRGLHDLTSDRTLTLVNGRVVDSAVFGGSEYNRFPVLLEDIDRIEIVRGPAGAAWGANAFTGLVNIITKKPEDLDPVYAGTTINEYGDLYSQLRWAQQNSKWAYRLSAGYEGQTSSDLAGAGDFQSSRTGAINSLIGLSGYRADDFARNMRFDTDAEFAWSEQTQMTGGLAYLHGETGNFEFGGYYPDEHMLSEVVRPFVKVHHEIDENTSGYVQWFSNYLRSKTPSFCNWDTLENDIETQLNLDHGNHRLSLGGNVRAVSIKTEQRSAQNFVFNGQPYDEYLVGLFVIDRWALRETMTLEAQLRGDWYSGTHADWAGRVSALQALDAKKRHILRLSWARGYRMPLVGLRAVSGTRIPLGGGLHAFNVLLPGSLKNERTWSLESGYVGEMNDSLLVRGNLYYQHFDNMIGYQTIPDATRSIYQVAHTGNAESWGTELEFEKRIRRLKLAAWYAYNDFLREYPHQNLRSYAPARHKVGLTGRLPFADTWVANANYRYSTTTEPFASTLGQVVPTHRLDLVLVYKFLSERGELTLGIMDIFNNDNGPNRAMGQITGHTTPGRTWFARAQCNF